MDRSKRKNRKHRSFEENIRINKLIIQANNENAIFTIIKRQGVQFNIVNCSTSFSAFAKRAPINVNHEMFSQLCNITKTKFILLFNVEFIVFIEQRFLTLFILIYFLYMFSKFNAKLL